jgi:guanylate kinase
MKEKTPQAQGRRSAGKPLLIVISAPSGGGKTTVCQQLLAANPGLTRAVTCTTRAPRPGEKDGTDYFFLKADTFLKRVEAGRFLEHATVYGNSYGTLKSEVLEKLREGRDVLLSVDVQGVASIRKRVEEDEELRRALITVFITPQSLLVLEERLKKRGQDSAETIRKRLSVARHEIAHWEQFDYLVVSTTITEDFRRVQAIVEAEKMKQFRSAAPTL